MPYQDQDPNRPTDADLVEQIRSRYAQGLTLRELAQELGRDEEAIRRLMVAADIPRRPRGQPEGKYLPNGGRTVDRDGYILFRAPKHPYANAAGYIREHRLVMEGIVDRFLRPEEVVHHRDGVKSNNSPDNLELFPSNAEHKQHDMIGNAWALGDINNPKRSVRVMRSPRTLLNCLRNIAARLNRPIQRNDLHPPNPSYRAVAHAFGSWQNGVALALDDEYLATWEKEQEAILSGLRRS
jgi:hypothetical protein